MWDGACSISKCIPVALKRNLERAPEEGLVRIPLKWLRRRHVVKSWPNARVLETSAQCCWLSVHINFGTGFFSLCRERITIHGLFVAILLQSSVLSKLHASEEELLLLQAFSEEGGFFAAPGKSAARPRKIHPWGLCQRTLKWMESSIPEMLDCRHHTLK